MSEHTKGPWFVDGPTANSESYDCFYVRTRDGDIVAETDAWGGRTDGSDARLISKAPAMKAALQAFVEYFEGDYDQPPEYHKAVRILAAINA